MQTIKTASTREYNYGSWNSSVLKCRLKVEYVADLARDYSTQHVCGGDRTATEAGIATRGISWPPFWAELNVHRLYETNTELDTGTSENKYINGFCDRIIFFWHNCGKGWVRTLIGIPLHLLQRLKSAMNSAARLVFSSSKYDSVSPRLHRLHWLKVPKRIQFKLAVTTFKCLLRTSPRHHHTSLASSSGLLASRLEVVFAQRRHHWSSVLHGCLLSATELLRSLLLVSGTNCHASSRPPPSSVRVSCSRFSCSFPKFL